MSITKSSALVLILSLSLAGCGTSQSWTAPAETTPSLLLQQPLDPAFVADREVVINHVEFAPNATLSWHTHPGEAYHYYIEGSVTIEIEGAESIHGTPGTVGHVPLRAKHRAIAGPDGARVIVFRVHVEGEPVRHVVEEPAGDDDHDDDDTPE